MQKADFGSGNTSPPNPGEDSKITSTIERHELIAESTRNTGEEVSSAAPHHEVPAASTESKATMKSKEEINKWIHEQAVQVRRSFSKGDEEANRSLQDAFQPHRSISLSSRPTFASSASVGGSLGSSPYVSSQPRTRRTSIDSIEADLPSGRNIKRRRRSADPLKESSYLNRKKSFDMLYQSQSSHEVPGMIAHPATPPPFHFTGFQPLIQLKQNEESVANLQQTTLTKNDTFSDTEAIFNRPSQRGHGMKLNHPPYEILVNNNDVVSGKGPALDNLVGNRRFQILLDIHQKSYENASSSAEKQLIARSIVKAINGATPSGRFIRMDQSFGMWVIVPDELSTKIVQEALSERQTLCTSPLARGA